MSSPIYLDYAAATPVDQRVLMVMQPYFAEKFYNPSATYKAAQDIKKELETARGKVARVIGARSSEIIFTAGGTEANNLAIRGVLQQYPEANIVVSAIEHESVLAPAQLFSHQSTPVKPDGTVDTAALIRLINDQTVLVSVMYANNEVGTIQPIRQIALLLKQIREDRRHSNNKLPLYLHTDAAQAANYLDLHVARLGVDLMTLNGGKIYGPKASGVLFVAHHVRIRPQIVGGGQERAMRSGTENIAACVGFAEALELTQADRHLETTRLGQLQHVFLDVLEEQLPEVIINGSRKHRLPNNIHITIPKHDNERLLIELDEAGILCAAGSACSASNDEPSHVLRAMGINELHARASLRFSLGRDTEEQDIRKTITKLVSFVRA